MKQETRIVLIIFVNIGRATFFLYLFGRLGLIQNIFGLGCA